MRQPRYAREHRASQERRGRQPQGLGALLAWYRREWRAEVPDALHVHRPWVGPPARPNDGVWAAQSSGQELSGGTRLGTPAHQDEFRRYLENTARERDEDGELVRPVHAALDGLSGRHPLMARALFALAWCGFDYDGLGVRLGLAPEMAADYFEAALGRLWDRYYAVPQAKWTELSEAQQRAVEAGET